MQGHTLERSARPTAPAMPFIMTRTAYSRVSREQARALDGAPRLGRTKEAEDTLLLRGRSPERAMWVLALGHVLFQCPPVLMAFVNHWMSWRIFNHESATANAVKCEDAFDRLLYAAVNDGVDLQIRLKRVDDRLNATTCVSYELSTMHNTDKYRLSDFACSAEVLCHACRGLGAPLPEMRLRALICYLFAADEKPLFSHSIESPDGNLVHFSNFADNPLLQSCQDRSAMLLGVGVYLASYLAQASERADAPDADKHAMARLDAGRMLIKQYESFVHELHERCTVLSRNRSVALPEELCVYRIDDDDDDDDDESMPCGVPREVAEYEVYTLLWLKWAWAEYVTTGRQSIRQLLSDLWYVKSAVLLERYHTFFVDDRFDTQIVAVAQRVKREASV